ncbi:MAG: cupin-like domain-containing protein, partial [Roseovarius confluentis]
LLDDSSDNLAAPVCYVGSTTIDKCLPGLRDENDIDLGGRQTLASIWIGNRTVIGAHFDALYNIACVAAGRRRVTLFPPDEIENLYIGPLDPTPAGQPVSLVDFNDWDVAKYPRFAHAMERALIAELGPGDGLFIPSAWWHHVESLDTVNVLVNYWWRDSPAFMGNPMDALAHALLNIRDLSPAERDRWRSIFEHYVFDWENGRADHIPAQARGSLGPMDDPTARRLRAVLLNR